MQWAITLWEIKCLSSKLMLYNCQQTTYAAGSHASVPAASTLTQNTTRSRHKAGSGNEDQQHQDHKERLSVWVRNEAHAANAKRGAQQLVSNASDALPTA